LIEGVKLDKPNFI